MIPESSKACSQVRMMATQHKPPNVLWIRWYKILYIRYGRMDATHAGRRVDHLMRGTKYPRAILFLLSRDFLRQVILDGGSIRVNGEEPPNILVLLQL